MKEKNAEDKFAKLYQEVCSKIEGGCELCDFHRLLYSNEQHDYIPHCLAKDVIKEKKTNGHTQGN